MQLIQLLLTILQGSEVVVWTSGVKGASGVFWKATGQGDVIEDASFFRCTLAACQDTGVAQEGCLRVSVIIEMCCGLEGLSIAFDHQVKLSDCFLSLVKLVKSFIPVLC